VCQIKEGSCGLATPSGTLVVWKLAGGEVLAALLDNPSGVVLKRKAGGERIILLRQRRKSCVFGGNWK
jgi:hypothetical protein